MDLEKLVLPLEVADKKFNLGLAGAIAGVGALLGAMGAAIKMTFDWAESLDQIGDVMDVTNEQAAAFGFIARKSGVATETFTKAVVIMSKGLVKADGTLDTVGKGLESWGINVKDVNGKLKSQTALVADISKKYGTFSTQQEKVNFLTEVFGRSGAELIDFFDVMAKEGGIDAVTEKVKRFGLVIDPARYEQFSRNLEELKLIGTGLAVTFTEKLMPALETMMTWFGNLAAQSPEENFTMIKNTVHDLFAGLFNLTDAFKRGVGEIDWAGLSQDLADGINNIDWVVVGLYIRTGVKNILDGLYTIISEIDWAALAVSTGTAVQELTAGLYGYANFEALAMDFNNGFASLFGYDTAGAWEQLKTDFTNGALAIGDPLVALGDSIIKWWTQLWIDFDMGANALGETLIGMYNTAAEWIGKIVGLINLIPGINNIGLGNTMGKSTPPDAGGMGRRASGGAVIAGQQYQVAEFNRPETFTPSTNGRVDPLQPAMAGMGSDVFIQRFADVIARSLRAELQKSGRK